MKGAIAWFANNTVAANLLMALIVIGGLATVPFLPMEVFPEFTVDMVTITVPYLGASPEEVEEGVCIRIEEAIQGLDGIKRITSTATEGVGAVTAELLRGEDASQVLDDIKNRVDAIETFPEETEKPIIQEIVFRSQVINVAISGDVEEESLRQIAERVRDEILSIQGISQADLVAARPYEVSIEVSEEALRRHGLAFDDVAAAVRRGSLDLPGGSVKTRGGEILFRTKGQAYRRQDFEELLLLSRPDGTRIVLGDVAEVVDAFADTDQQARFNGEPTVLVQVSRVGDESALGISASVKEYVAEARERMPAGVSLTTWRDDARVLRGRLDLLMRNAKWGLVLVFLVLTLFLRLRLAFWVTLGIPISFLGAIWLMPFFGVTINVISLFAFILVLGIVVDDAIVVGESIFWEQRRGRTGVDAAIVGTKRVYTPVIFAVLTSVAAFSPLLMIPGAVGKIIFVIPLIVIPTLLFSLVESQLVLPAHLSHYRGEGDPRRQPRIVRLWTSFQGFFARGLEVFIERAYRPSLEFGVRWRYFTIAWGLATLILTVGLVAGGLVKFLYFPDVEADYAVAMLEMPLGTPAEVTTEAVARMEASARELRAQIERETGLDHFRHVLASVGEQPYRREQARGDGIGPGAFSGGHLGEVSIELLPSEERTMSSEAIASRWRELTGSIPDAVTLTFTSSIFHTGEPINVQFAGPDITRLRKASDELKESLRDFDGVVDITDSFREGKQEIRLEILPAAESLGITLGDLARQVRQGFYGEEAQRIQRGRDDIRVMVRYPLENRRSLGDLENMRIRTPQGGEVPFSTVARANPGRGYSTIRRADRMRTISVTADIDATVPGANAGDIRDKLAEDILPNLLAHYPGMTYTFEGESREQAETLNGVMVGIVAFALPMIYLLMAVPFRSYVQPLIVMSAIPFGIVGAIWGHVIMGIPLSIMSMFGLVALTGVVVNDSLVLVDFINRMRAEGKPIEEAVRDAGTIRFRPIILTSLTTFAGITPLLLETSVQAQFLIPMAVSLGFGIVFATFITLVLVPVLYVIQQDLLRVGYRTWAGLHRGWDWLYGHPEPQAAARIAGPPRDAPTTEPAD